MTTADREAAIDEFPPTTPSRAPRRHTAEVTADRLQADLVNFVDYLTPIERTAMNRAIVALDSVPDRIRLAGGDDE